MQAEGQDVLVVDDDLDLRTSLELLLSDEGYVVRGAENGVEALARVGEAMPAVILLDIRMPVMDGRAFLREFRSRFAHQARVVVVTAAENPRRDAEELGADAWISKPFELEEVLSTLRRWIPLL